MSTEKNIKYQEGNFDKYLNLSHRILRVHKNPSLYFLITKTKEGVNISNINEFFNDIGENENYNHDKLLWNNLSFRHKLLAVAKTVMGYDENEFFIINANRIDYFKSHILKSLTEKDFVGCWNYINNNYGKIINEFKYSYESKAENNVFAKFISKLPSSFSNLIFLSNNLKIRVENNHSDAIDFIYVNNIKNNNIVKTIATITPFLEESTSLYSELRDDGGLYFNLKVEKERAHEILIKNINNVSELSHEIGHYLCFVIDSLSKGFFCTNHDDKWREMAENFVKNNPEAEITKRLKLNYEKDQYSLEVAAYMYEKLIPKIIEVGQKSAFECMKNDFEDLFNYFEKIYIMPLANITAEDIKKFESYTNNPQPLTQLVKVPSSIKTLTLKALGYQVDFG